MMWIFAALVVPLALAGCAQRPATVEGEVPSGGADVFADPAAFQGRTVRVEGVLHGYRVAECRFAPAARAVSLTRSDWLVRRGAGCLYVTGGVPPGVNPMNPAAAGRALELQATVIADPDGRFLLRLVEARPH
jgi:hypothetical protein